MKGLVEFIQEARKYFKLEESERDALATFLGILTGNLGEDDERAALKGIKLSDEEMKTLDDLYTTCLDDDQTYPVINRNIIKDELPLLVKVYKMMDENDLLGENWDLIDAFEKIAENA